MSEDGFKSNTGGRQRRSLISRPCGCLSIAIGIPSAVAVMLALVLAFVPSARWKLAAAMSKSHALHARIYNEALARGDAVQAFQRADDRFKAVYSEEALTDYFKEHLALLQLPSSVSMTSRSVNGTQYWSTSFNDALGKRIEIFVQESHGQLHLLGISPELVAGIPPEVHNFEMFDDGFGGDLF